MPEYIINIVSALLALEWLVASKGAKTIKKYFLILHQRRILRPINPQPKRDMNLKKQLIEKNRFLKKAYEVAYDDNPSSPLSIGLEPIEVGKLLGFNEINTERIMMELVEDRYVESSLGMGILFITNQGLKYLRQIEDEPETIAEEYDKSVHSNTNESTKTTNMKQSTKLDLILKELYKYKNDGYLYSIASICDELNIPLDSLMEVRSLATRLRDAGLINGQFKLHDFSAQLTSHGIDYCEEDSYTYSGHSIVNNNYNNISITNSPNTNIVNNSSNVEISSSINEVSESIERIFEVLVTDNTIDESKLTEISECLKEIQESLKNNQKPKFAIKSLIEIASGISSIGSWITVLGQFAGIFPVPK